MMEIDFASLVKELRQARNLTQEQLAREMNVSFATVNSWERGRHRPIAALAKQLLKMAEEAGITPGQPGGSKPEKSPGRKPTRKRKERK